MQLLSLPEPVIRWLRQLPESSALPTVEKLNRTLGDWAQRGAYVTTVGFSREGRPIRMASIGDGDRQLLAWGFPHPDEPLGAEALRLLGDALLSGQLTLEGWTAHLILCADPDNAARQLWLGRPVTAESFVRGTWRPEHLGLEVDYGFALDWGPFYHPESWEGECRLPSECRERCGSRCQHAGKPFAPLPESVALATAIDLVEPDVVGLMHNTHTGGDYTFLLRREPEPVMEALLAAPAVFGLARHLGVPIDRGRSWRRGAPDLLADRGLDWFERRLRRQPDFSDEFLYAGCHSAACYVQASFPSAQVITPESALFRHPWFGDTAAAGLHEVARVSVEDRPRAGRCEVVRICVDGRWVIAQQRRAPSLPVSAPRQARVPMTAAMAGVRAVYERQRVMREADRLWLSTADLPGRVWHPYVDERERLHRARSRARTPVAGEGWLRHLRAGERFHRPITRAQFACFAWLWPLHTAATLGNFQNYLAAQPDGQVGRLRSQLTALQDRQLAGLPEQMRAAGPLKPALASMLARLLTVLT